MHRNKRTKYARKEEEEEENQRERERGQWEGMKRKIIEKENEHDGKG